jgi:hypothetical protein
LVNISFISSVSFEQKEKKHTKNNNDPIDLVNVFIR